MSKRKIIKIVISVLIAALTALGQRRSYYHEQVGILPARRHLGHDPNENHRVLRRFEEAVRGENHFSYDASKKL